MALVRDNRLRGIRQTVPAGHLIGRLSGDGKAQLLNGAQLRQILGPGYVKAIASGATQALTSAHIFVGNSSNIATDVAMSGDTTIDNAGAVTIGANKVQEGKLDLSDITTFNVSITKHGFAPKAPNVATQYLDGTGAYSTPAGSGLSATLTNTHIFVGNGSNVATDVALSGDATLANTGALTLANTAVTPATYGDANNVGQFTVDSKGRITAAVNVAVSGGGGTVSNTATLSVPLAAATTLSFAAVGNVITPSVNLQVTGLGINMTTVTSATLKFGIAPYNRSTNKVTSAPTYAPTVTIGTGAAKQPVYANFSSPFAMTAGSDYIIFMVRTDGVGSVSQTVYFTSADVPAPGLFLSTTVNATAWQIANTAPGTGDTWSTGGGGSWSTTMVYGI